MATLDVKSPLIGTVFRITVAAGDQVRGGQEILIVESMKMEHPVEAPADGTVESILVAEGDTIAAGQVLVRSTRRGARPVRWVRRTRSVPTLPATANAGS
jgi:biotin carboxyl carrier protein